MNINVLLVRNIDTQSVKYLGVEISALRYGQLNL